MCGEENKRELSAYVVLSGTVTATVHPYLIPVTGLIVRGRCARVVVVDTVRVRNSYYYSISEWRN